MAEVPHMENPRKKLSEAIAKTADDVVVITSRLVSIPSENPPGDTGPIAETVAEIIRGIEGAEVELVTSEPPIVNVAARLRGNGAGRRLVFNGHLDTFPAGERSRWDVDPFNPVERDGRLYGRGISDMKGGVAGALYAMKTLSLWRQHWVGELVLTFAGDEETMGLRGTQHLLDHVPYANGDAMICGDAGSPRVLRFGEKGMVWLELTARGRASHGAHVHMGENAIELLMNALQRLASLRECCVEIPAAAADAIDKAGRASEALSGKGEAEVIRTVTVNFGTITGGSAPNLVADRARANVDIRVPLGIRVSELETRIGELLDPLPGLEYRVTNRYEPSWTDPDHEIIAVTAAACEEILGERPLVNMRVGASDARLYRYHGVPSVVFGVTPYGLGAANEHVMADELRSLGKIFTLAAFDYLQPPG